MLIRRPLSTPKVFVMEYELTVDVTLVPSSRNIADRRTRVQQRWFNTIKKDNGLEPLIGTVHVDELNVGQIMSIHRSSGHPAVQRTTFQIKRV